MSKAHHQQLSTCDISPARWRLWLLALLLASTLTSFVGTGRSLPLDAHEVFVARTAEEMHNRSEWLVPHFNDTPRLKKPPLGYWLVIGVNYATGNDSVITEFEARFPSAIAGILMTLMAVRLGRELVSPEVGLIAGAMLATCSGLISYSHSARPEMVYAAWCLAGLLGLVAAEQHKLQMRKRDALLAAMGAWICFGMATMTKGPQLPLPMLVGWLFGSWRAGTLKQTIRSLHMAIGIPLYLIVGFWWFWVVLMTVPDAGEILKVETIDRITSQTRSWLTLLEPYYLYRPLLMLAPWLFFVPLALLGPWLKKYRTRPGAMRLWWMILLVAVILSFSRGRRWYYMLPMLAPYTVLMASAAMQMAPLFWRERKTWIWAALFGILVLGIGVFAALAMNRHAAYLGDAPIWMFGTLALACLISLALLVIPKLRHALGFVGMTMQVAVIASVSLSLVSQRSGYWRSNRFDERAFSLQVAERVTAEDTIVGWIEPFDEQQYELHRPIPVYSDTAELAETVHSHGPLYILVDTSREALVWPSTIAAERLISANYGDIKDHFELWLAQSVSESSE